MNPDEATSLKQLFLSMLPKDGGIVVGTVTKESPLTIQIENDEKLEISGSALLVPRNLTDYQVKVDIALADGKIDLSRAQKTSPRETITRSRAARRAHTSTR